ncbi:MAG: hypothetical protein ACREGC_01100 [Minisyncoccia bacterium]
MTCPVPQITQEQIEEITDRFAVALEGSGIPQEQVEVLLTDRRNLLIPNLLDATRRCIHEALNFQRATAKLG